ncbi:AsmA family protein [Aeromonas caviae]|uniref:AsmA family protein n=1 Tax=Aeromonas caviae TaxID=648 RepID=A0A3G9I7F1_AERCA|nr:MULTISPECIES: AsmA family protein [Aeromonas]MDU7310160.1 AsmA family protein [Aeromonas sp.]AUV16256.1 AsmA family protein [Aeromonas sp. ASNIH7]KDV03165.1 cell envelope biogenesis protein AsmA [Aeromonas sp. HZM]KMY39510.1 cell envelope biogenesis protein AsmA [Aeromonas caviae]KOG93235.1 cell envelope biogenesis protein AsmA [Aeromonas caviae]
MKKIIYILLGLALAAVVAIAALVSLIDPNQFKPQLAEQVRKSTGRELVIQGDIGWRFWPSLGLSLEKVALRNPAGFAEPDLVRFEQGEASVGLLPLLSHRLEIGKVTLSGAHLFIQTRADGSSNLRDLLQASADPKGEATSEPAATTPPAASDKQPWQISLQGIALVDASALVRDDRSGTVSRLDRLDLDLGQLTPGEWVPVTLAAKGAQGDLAFDLKGQAQLKPAREAMKSELKDLNLSGSLNQPTQRLDAFSLKADRLALGEWSSLSLSLSGAQGAADKPTLAGTLEGTLKARLDENRQLLELSDAVLAAKLSGDALPRPQMQLKLAGFARAELDKQAVTLSNLVMGVDDALLSGSGAVRLGAVPKVDFDLKGEKLDLDGWLGQPAKAAPVAATSGAAAPAGTPTQTAVPANRALSTAEPDLTALKSVDLAGRLQLGSLRLKGLDLSAVDLQLALAGGQLTLKQFSAGVAGGQVTASGVLDARQQPARYQVHKRVQGVEVRPLLQTLAQTDLLEGKGDLEVEVQGSGLSEQALRSRMQGKVNLKLSDGALHGINLAEMIREARATLTGKGADQVKEVRKTDFSALTASFQIADGIARSDDIQLFAPALRVKGQGQTALVPETLDFLFLTSVVESSKGQGGKTVDELKDITIPVRIGGHWQAPSYKLDVKALLSNNKVLEEKARKEAERGLKKLLGDKADNEGVKGVADQLLKGLFK